MLTVIQIRIPKTATTSIEVALKNMKNNRKIKFKQHGHAKTRHILNRYTTEQLQSAVVVASVRNPFDRLVSAYQYIIQFKKDKRDKELKYVFDYPAFRDFAMDIPNIFEKNQFFHPQCRWLFDGEKKLYNFAIRYEQLNEGWKRFVRTYHLPNVDLPTRRKTIRKSWKTYYDKESLGVVRKMYNEDFRRLKYGD